MASETPFVIVGKVFINYFDVSHGNASMPGSQRVLIHVRIPITSPIKTIEIYCFHSNYVILNFDTNAQFSVTDHNNK